MVQQLAAQGRAVCSTKIELKAGPFPLVGLSRALQAAGCFLQAIEGTEIASDDGIALRAPLGRELLFLQERWTG